MQIEIPYGSTALSCTVPAGSISLQIREPAKRISPDLFKTIIRKQLKTHPPDLSSTCIIIADKTRVCGYPTYLPLLVDTLKEFGLDVESLRFIIAYGTHPRQSDDECLQGYGEIYSKSLFIHHDCNDKELFVNCGTTSRGVPVRIRRDIYDASFVITMGPICHHYFAGYGGGRKLIFPGCGEKEAIYANHSLYLDKEHSCLATTCQPGVITGNPLAEDLFEIADHKQADLSIHGIMDSHGTLCDILVGSDKQTYLNACALHGELCESPAQTHPLVIASCGGYPKDINFIQSHKALHNASMFVEDDGMLVIFSECRDGIGSQTFLPWFKMGGFHQAFDQLCVDYQGNGGTALAMMTKARRIRIAMVTQLDQEICSAINVDKWSLEQAASYISKQDKPLCYIPNASLLVKKSS